MWESAIDQSEEDSYVHYIMTGRIKIGSTKNGFHRCLAGDSAVAQEALFGTEKLWAHKPACCEKPACRSHGVIFLGDNSIFSRTFSHVKPGFCEVRGVGPSRCVRHALQVGIVLINIYIKYAKIYQKGIDHGQKYNGTTYRPPTPRYGSPIRKRR